MSRYEITIQHELREWQKQMLKKPSMVNRITKKVQDKINNVIPEKVHNAITSTIKQMFRAVLFGSEKTTSKNSVEGDLEKKEAVVFEKINWYKKTAAAEGGITGAGGILMGLADFPLLMGLKIKLLFEIASVYGFDISDYKERLYILYIFQMAFSSKSKRKQVYQNLENWQNITEHLPPDIHQFDWKTFQQEYRDYIDLAKMAQLIPIIGAPVGAVVNYKLIEKLGKTAMNAYRMRWFENRKLIAG